MTDPEGGVDRAAEPPNAGRSGPPGQGALPGRLGIGSDGESPWRSVAAAIVVVIIGFAVFRQLFRDGGLAMPGEGAEAAWPLLAPAIAAAALAAITNPRSAVRALLTVPVLALAGLAALTFISAEWTTVLPVEATRIGMATLAYCLIAVAAAVASARLSALPVAIMLVAVAIVAGLMGLWGFANIVSPLAVINQGELTPGGPFRYRNTLALLSAASLLPLARWAVWRSRSLLGNLIAVGAGAGLGVSVTVVAISGSDFAILMALVIGAVAVLFPARVLGSSRQQSLAILGAALLVGILAWYLFGKVLGETPEEGAGRTQVMAGLVFATPLLVRVLGFAAARIPDLIATRVVQLGIGLVLVAGVLTLFASSSPGDLTQARQVYYRVTIETAKQEPIKGFGAGSFAQASVPAQSALLPGQTRFAHTVPGEMWVELGIGGLVLSLLLYVGSFVLAWRTRLIEGGVLLIPLVAGFLASGLIDWSWHMTALTALWAAALGGLTGLRLSGSTPDGQRAEAVSPSSA